MEANVNTQKVSGEKPSLFGMITSPGLQFERMRTNAPVWGAFFLLVLLGGIVFMAASYASLNNPELVKALKEDPTGTAKYFIMGGGFIAGLITTMIMFFISAAFYKVIMMFMGNDTTYKKLLSITVYSSVITCLGLLVNAVLAIILGGDGIERYTSLGPLFEKGTTAFSIGNSIEIFTIWGIFVTWLGLHITAGLSKKQATILVVIFFVISLAFSAFRGLGA
ncbi:Yip1 family protein [Bacillus sp. 123MFChir2]|uniref:Yip1 family protein n=1 Tax=Bacillus sp. 123MFChir2 TaxID=1169144 RepID=UPI00036E120F|nr:Yip1 family protein [Bacillus sp. 123MFChir2]